jgi:hypothetical protein
MEIAEYVLIYRYLLFCSIGLLILFVYSLILGEYKLLLVYGIIYYLLLIEVSNILVIYTSKFSDYGIW